MADSLTVKFSFENLLIDMCAFRARIRLPQKLIFCSAVECMGRIQEWEFEENYLPLKFR